MTTLTIDDFVSFFQGFLDARHEQDLGTLTEPDEQVLPRVTHTQGFLHAPAMRARLARQEGMSPEEIAHRSRGLGPLVRPPLFLVAEFVVPGPGSCFAGYAGGQSELSACGYEHRYWARVIDGVPKIVADDMIDFNDMTAVHWSRVSGEVIENEGDPVAARGVREPVGRRYRQDYQRLLDLAGQAG